MDLFAIDGYQSRWDLLAYHVVEVLIFVVVGLILFGLAIWVIDWLTPFSIRKEIAEDQNMALAIILGSVMIGIALIVAAAVRGG